MTNGISATPQRRRVASNIAKLPSLLGASKESELDFQKEAVSGPQRSDEATTR